MKIYLKFLSLCYLFGALVHFADLANLGQIKFTQMIVPWQIATILFALLDTSVFIGLWMEKWWGIVCFFIAAISQITMYSLFKQIFTEQPSLIIFHICTVSLYGGFILLSRKTSLQPKD